MKRIGFLTTLLFFLAMVSLPAIVQGQQYHKPQTVNGQPCRTAPNVYKRVHHRYVRHEAKRTIAAPVVPVKPPCDECDLIKQLLQTVAHQQEVTNGIVHELVEHDAVRAKADLNRSEAAKIDAQADLANADANKLRAGAEASQAANESLPTSPQGMLILAKANLLNRTAKYPKSEEARRWVGTFLNPLGLVMASHEFGASIRPDQYNSSTVATGGSSAGGSSSATGGSSNATGGNGTGGNATGGNATGGNATGGNATGGQGGNATGGNGGSATGGTANGNGGNATGGQGGQGGQGGSGGQGGNGSGNGNGNGNGNGGHGNGHDHNNGNCNGPGDKSCTFNN